MTQSTIDAIRSATLGKKTAFRNKIFEYEGVEVEVREPNLKSKRELLKRSKDSNGDLEIISFMVWAVIFNTYLPGTNDKVFTVEDYDAMINQYSGSFVEKFSAEISELMNAEEDESSEKKES